MLKYLILFLWIPIHLTAFFVSTKEIEKIKSNPKNTYNCFRSHQLIFEELTESENYIIFCMQVAYQIAPYGVSSGGNLNHLLSCKYLNCANYGILACFLCEKGNKELFDQSEVMFVGWDNGAFGNHQTLWINDRIFCDPTCGLYAQCSCEDIYNGKKINRIYDWHVRDDICQFREKIKNAIQKGLCKNNYIIYFLTYEEYRKYCY